MQTDDLDISKLFAEQRGRAAFNPNSPEVVSFLARRIRERFPGGGDLKELVMVATHELANTLVGQIRARRASEIDRQRRLINRVLLQKFRPGLIRAVRQRLEAEECDGHHLSGRESGSTPQ